MKHSSSAHCGGGPKEFKRSTRIGFPRLQTHSFWTGVTNGSRGCGISNLERGLRDPFWTGTGCRFFQGPQDRGLRHPMKLGEFPRLSPRARSCSSASRSSATAGRPMCLPCSLVRRIPDFTRSTIRFLSSSAMAEMITTMARPSGPPAP